MKTLLAATLTIGFAACTDDHAMPVDNPPTPTSFTVQLDNIAPWTVLKSGLQAQQTTGTTGAAGPGGAFEMTFTAGKKQSVSFATMFGESNDWFFAPGPAGIALYDANGAPISGDVTSQVTLWNAGTEIDQEPGVGDATGPHQPSPNFGAADPDPTVREIPLVATLTDGSTFARPATDQMIKVTLTPGANRQFTLRVENVSTPTTLVTSQGSRPIHLSPVTWALHIAPSPLFQPGSPDRNQGLEFIAESGNGTMLSSELRELSGAATPISPGVYAVHRSPEPLYSLGLVNRGQGLEALSESGDNSGLLAAMTTLAAGDNSLVVGAFDTPVGATARGAATPGNRYTLTVQGLPGDRLSFVTMFGMSDDWFFGTQPDGIALFDDTGAPRTGDVSDEIAIYDTGTEIDEELAIGPDTGPQQPAPNTGAVDPIAQVREADYPKPASAHLRVTLTPM